MDSKTSPPAQSPVGSPSKEQTTMSAVSSPGKEQTSKSPIGSPGKETSKSPVGSPPPEQQTPSPTQADHVPGNYWTQATLVRPGPTRDVREPLC
ncbi:hypothetical protein IMZ48_13765 [Candidatus Bathyarchaeota archaeon]|nr:hypothetical protein [Candidatus Bathyarchaeota archaeon]